MRFVFLFFGVCSLFIANTQISTTNLVGHYKFDGDLTDFSGNGNHITKAKGSFKAGRLGNQNGGFYLNGSSDSLSFPIKEFSPIVGDFAISFWYKTNSPEIMNLFSSKQGTRDTTNNFEIQLSSNDINTLQYNKQSYYTTFGFWNGSGLNQNAIGEGTAGAFTKGEWCHFVLARVADTFKIYRNHQLSYLSLNNLYGGTLGDAIDLVFSAKPYLFQGVIDDMRLYKRSLNQADVDMLWFEERPFTFYQLKPTDSYVKGSKLLVTWEYDLTQISDSILVETKINGGAWTPVVHSNNHWESFTNLDLNYPAGTRIELRVSDFSNPLLTNSTGEFSVSPYDWVEVQDTLPFHAKDGSGLLVFKDKMWLLGGWDPPYHEPTNTHSEVWSSSDGANWDFITSAPWPARHAAAWIVGNGAMWVICGDPQSGCLTDVWKSEDGLNWVQTNAAIPGFVSRSNPNYAFVNGKLTVYGGEQCSGEPLNDVWTSVDGMTWTKEQNAPWKGRGMQINSCVDGSGNMWMLGGSNEGNRRSYNEVWKSVDGVWTLVNESAPWAGRYWHTVSWFDNKMWLFGGMATGSEMNDVWYSEDGVKWHELKTTTGNWPAGTRHAQSGTNFKDAVWYMCGISTNNAWKIVDKTKTSSVKEKTASMINWSISPNPVKDKLTVNFKDAENNDIQIKSLEGSVVKVINTKSSLKVELDVSNLPNGMYFITNQNQSIKFVKQ